MRAPLTACREPARTLWQLCKVLCFWTSNAISFNPCSIYPHCGYFDISVTYLQIFRWVKFVVIPPRFVWQLYLWNIAIQQAVGCYNSWANLRCSSCSPLGGKIFVKWDNFIKTPFTRIWHIRGQVFSVIMINNDINNDNGNNDNDDTIDNCHKRRTLLHPFNPMPLN